jgi:hypothetical protein
MGRKEELLKWYLYADLLNTFICLYAPCKQSPNKKMKFLARKLRVVTLLIH